MTPTSRFAVPSGLETSAYIPYFGLYIITFQCSATLHLAT